MISIAAVCCEEKVNIHLTTVVQDWEQFVQTLNSARVFTTLFKTNIVKQIYCGIARGIFEHCYLTSTYTNSTFKVFVW